MLKNKRGASAFLVVLIILAILVFITLAFWYSENANIFGFWSNAIDSVDLKTAVPINTLVDTSNAVVNGVVTTLGYVIGEVPNNLVESSGPVNAIIVLIALWIIIILMFGDILANFGGFSREISWVIAILLGIVGANLKMMTAIAAVLTAIFLPLGMLAAYAGLFAAFVAFFAVEWGIQSMMPWVMRRKGAQQAVRAKATTGTIIEAIKHYRTVGDELHSA